MKIILIQGLLAPYRYPIFEELSKTPGWEFEVWFMGKEVKNRIWREDSLSDYHFAYKFLGGKTLNLGIKDNYPIWINSSAITELKQANPDVVIMMGWDSLTSFTTHYYCLTHNIKFVLYSDSTPLERSWRRTLTYPLVKLHVQTADALICGGTRSREYLEELGANPDNIYISYNTIDVERYAIQAAKFRESKGETLKVLGLTGKQIILYYGQLIERKGIDILINAYLTIKSKNENIALLIIGDGPYKKHLETLIKNNNLRDVIILANPGDYEISRYYAIADVFVLPSREDVWGLVVNEAMASGIPVIVSDHAGCASDLVTSGVDGYIFKSKNIYDLSKKLKKVLENKVLQKNMSRNVKQKIKFFTPKLTIKQFESAITNTLDAINQKITFKNPVAKGLVSVIIPSFHDRLGLEITLNSLKEQLDPPSYEIIVQTDKSGQGSYKTRNQAIEKSRGEFLAFIDSGTIADPDWLSQIMLLLKKSDYVGGPVKRMALEELPVYSWIYSYNLHREFAINDFYTDAHFFPTTNLGVKRSVVEVCGGFDGRLRSSGDLEFGDRVWRSRRFSQHYSQNLVVTHPLRTYKELVKKQRRLAEGYFDLRRYYPGRFGQISPLFPLFELIKYLLPPLWLLQKSSFRALPFSEKIKVFITSYHFSSIYHKAVIRHVLLRAS